MLHVQLSAGGKMAEQSGINTGKGFMLEVGET
jgi:hypothetical protein